MSGTKISDLPDATTPLAGTEVAAIVQGGTTKKVPVSEIGGGSGWTTVFKEADEVRTLSTTMADDDTLTLALDANSTYFVKFYVFIQTANATMDYKFAVNYTGTTSSIMSRREYRVAGVGDSGSSSFEVMNNAFQPPGAAAGATFGAAFVEVNMAIVTVDAGTLSFQWAQDTSNAGEIRVKAGTFMEYRKI